MILNVAGIGRKEDTALLMESGKKVVIVISVKQEKYVSIVIIDYHITVVVVNVVQYVMNI